MIGCVWIKMVVMLHTRDARDTVQELAARVCAWINALCACIIATMRRGCVLRSDSLHALPALTGKGLQSHAHRPLTFDLQRVVCPSRTEGHTGLAEHNTLSPHHPHRR